MPHPHTLASVAQAAGVDVGDIRRLADRHLSREFESAYDPWSSTVTDFGRDLLLAQFVDDDAVNW